MALDLTDPKAVSEALAEIADIDEADGGNPYVIATERAAAALISSLVAERDALAKVIDPEDNRPALMARIIMASVSRQARIYELEDLVEQAFRDGLAYGSNVESADPDVAWQQSRARASIGGGNG